MGGPIVNGEYIDLIEAYSQHVIIPPRFGDTMATVSSYSLSIWMYFWTVR